jgi:hypothetical protein
MNKAIEDAAEKYVEVYHLHDCKWSIKEIYKDGAFAPETEQYYREKFQAEQKPIGNVWVDVKDRLPIKFGMYVCKIKVIEDGLTYKPVAYCQFDTIKNDWTNPSVCNTLGEVEEWLDETPAPIDELSAIEIVKLAEERYPTKGEIITITINNYDLQEAHQEGFISGYKAAINK